MQESKTSGVGLLERPARRHSISSAHPDGVQSSRRSVSGSFAARALGYGAWHAVLFYAVTYGILDENLCLFAGVHCLPKESCDLERRETFVLLPYQDRAVILQADIFEAAMEASSSGSVQLMHVYDVRIAGESEVGRG